MFQRSTTAHSALQKTQVALTKAEAQQLGAAELDLKGFPSAEI
jgi:hypothetical protein